MVIALCEYTKNHKSVYYINQWIYVYEFYFKKAVTKKKTRQMNQMTAKDPCHHDLAWIFSNISYKIGKI